MKLHLGCFDQPHEGWHNTDITPHILIGRIPFVARLLWALGLMSSERMEQHQQGVFRKVHYLNVLKPFPFKDGEVECVFCSHLLEHLHPEAAKGLFGEVLRVLQPGGIFRVVVPDLDYFVSRYDRDRPEPFLTAVFEHDQRGAKNRHQWMYTDSSLRRLFIDTGFENVRVCQYKEGRLPDVRAVDNRPENSIYVEGCRSSPSRS